MYQMNSSASQLRDTAWMVESPGIHVCDSSEEDYIRCSSRQSERAYWRRDATPSGPVLLASRNRSQNININEDD